MALMVAVGRVLDLASGVADLGADHARDLAQEVLHPQKQPPASSTVSVLLNSGRKRP